ncbi:PLC-like phosphodiesterase, partial [Saccharata proteae CBS 121410]
TASTATACNNSPTLCNRAYGNVTLLGAHDSAFLRDSSTGNSIAGDQSYNTVAQLDAGARLLTAQVHSATAADGTQEWHLCHSYCFLLDAGRLSDWLRNISTWMDAHPHEVVTILLVNSDAASAEDLDSEFVASGVKKYVYTPPSPATASDAAIPAAKWPTLQQMIAADTRLVTFVASLANDNTGASYLLDEFTYVYENAYDNSSPDSFVCTPDRPSTVKGNPDAAAASNRLFLMNHFLYTDLGDSIQVPDLSAINATNAESGAGSLGAAVRQCEGVYGRAPLAVLVDFVGDGGSVEVVDRVNGVVGAVGRAGV